MEQPELKVEVALRIVGCSAGVGGTRPLQDRVRRDEFEFLAAVDAALGYDDISEPTVTDPSPEDSGELHIIDPCFR
jgi:hypothetical protein